jgi:hypothetical protein
MGWTIRTATGGDSRQRLNEAYFANLRKRYADLTHSLGYKVR